MKIVQAMVRVRGTYMIYILACSEHQPLIRANYQLQTPNQVHRLKMCRPLPNFSRSLPRCKPTRTRSFAGSSWRGNWLGMGELPPRLGAQLSMQDTRRRNLRKASRSAVGPVRPVRLNNLHKHSHGLLVSATSSAPDLGLCLSLEPLRNTVLLVGEEVVENVFSDFLSGRW